MGAECRSCVQALAARLDALERDNYQAEEALGAGSDDEEFNLQGELAEGGCKLQSPRHDPAPAQQPPLQQRPPCRRGEARVGGSASSRAGRRATRTHACTPSQGSAAAAGADDEAGGGSSRKKKKRKVDGGMRKTRGMIADKTKGPRGFREWLDEVCFPARLLRVVGHALLCRSAAARRPEGDPAVARMRPEPSVRQPGSAPHKKTCTAGGAGPGTR